VATTLLASTMATVVTAPLVAWNFGRLSLVGPITNVVAGPIMALAQPMMFVALALSPVPAVARWFADGAHPLLRAFDFVASTAAVVPGGAIAVAPSAATVCLGIVFVVALISACVSRFPGRSMVTAAGALALMACVPLAPGSTPATELHMIDVGQGNAFALRTRGGHWVLFNAGRAWKGGDDGRSTIVPYIAHRGGSLSAFVLSNARSDNVGGALSVLSALHPRVLMDGVSGRGAAPYLTALRAARGVGIAFRSIRAGDSLVVDEATIRFLAPAVGQHAAASNVVALVQVGAVRILLMGDATQSDERRLLADEPDFLAADVLQVARHGGAAATSAEFLHAVSPVIALVSVGTMGSYGDPSPAVMRRLAARGVDVLRTDRLSTVIVSTDGRSLAVTADGDRWEVPTAHRPLRDEF
jgi:competence protein ComEC